jgi:ribosomal-protein-alanine N-acetyltransferase
MLPAVSDHLSFSPMTRRDLRRVQAIEARIFPEPWSRAIFVSELDAKTRLYLVARRGRTLVGYAGCLSVDEETHITTVAVDAGQEHGGIGTALLLRIIRGALARGTDRFTLEVAAGNERAQSLYRRFGFVPVGVRKGYYQRTGEDAFVMWLYEATAPPFLARLSEIEAGLAARS